MRSGKRGARLPAAGQAFLVPLGKGHFSFCWVVPLPKSAYTEFDVDGTFTLASATWVGTEPPTPAELARPKVLVNTCPGAWKGPCVTMESRPVPNKFRPLGKVARPSVGRLKPRHYGGWYQVEHAARAQWEWDTDSKAVLTRQAKERGSLEKRWAADAEKTSRVEARSTARTLTQWARGKASLDELVGTMPKRRAAEVTALIREAAGSLLKLDAKATRKAKLVILDSLVLQINEWHRRVGAGVIETAERELLVAAIDKLGRVAGLRGGNFAESLRDW